MNEARVEKGVSAAPASNAASYRVFCMDDSKAADAGVELGPSLVLLSGALAFRLFIPSRDARACSAVILTVADPADGINAFMQHQWPWTDAGGNVTSAA